MIGIRTYSWHWPCAWQTVSFLSPVVLCIGSYAEPWLSETSFQLTSMIANLRVILCKAERPTHEEGRYCVHSFPEQHYLLTHWSTNSPVDRLLQIFLVIRGFGVYIIWKFISFGTCFSLQSLLGCAWILYILHIALCVNPSCSHLPLTYLVESIMLS